MNPSRPFILRPGRHHPLDGWRPPRGPGVAFRQLPISLPCRRSTTPQFKYKTFYTPGASPGRPWLLSVTAPLERQFGQIPGPEPDDVPRVPSVAPLSLSNLGLDLSIDVAEQGVQAAINGASNLLLPQGLPNPPIYSKVNPADAPHHDGSRSLQHLFRSPKSRTSPTPLLAPKRFLSFPASDSSASAVASAPPFAFRANPTALASYGLSPRRFTYRPSARANVRFRAKGHFRRPASGLQPSARTISSSPATAIARLIIAYSQWCAGAPSLTSPNVIDGGGKTPRQAAWANSESPPSF